jgi:hypothetical protein
MNELRTGWFLPNLPVLCRGPRAGRTHRVKPLLTRDNAGKLENAAIH